MFAFRMWKNKKIFSFLPGFLFLFWEDPGKWGGKIKIFGIIGKGG